LRIDGKNHGDLETDKLGVELRKSLIPSLSQAPFDLQVSILPITLCAKSIAEGLE